MSNFAKWVKDPRDQEWKYTVWVDKGEYYCVRFPDGHAVNSLEIPAIHVSDSAPMTEEQMQDPTLKWSHGPLGVRTPIVREEKKKATDQQVGGSHYKDMPIQPVEYIHKNKLSFLEGNVVKYITRHRAKNGKADVEKALHYCQLILQLEYGDE